MRRESHVRFCESAGVKLPRATHLIIVPLGIWLVVSLIPQELMAEYRAIASEAAQRPRSHGAAIVIIAIWVVGTASLAWVGFAYWGQAN